VSRRAIRGSLVAAVALLYILHQDDWLATSTVRFMGLPASLAWHLGLCLAAAVVMTAAVQLAWHVGLDDEDGSTGSP
jgi:hypothetical protein